MTQHSFKSSTSTLVITTSTYQSRITTWVDLA